MCCMLMTNLPNYLVAANSMAIEEMKEWAWQNTVATNGVRKPYVNKF